MSIKAVCRSEEQHKAPPHVRERSWNGWAGAGGDGWVRNHKPTTLAGNRMHLICICLWMIHHNRFTRVQNLTFILQMVIYDKQLIWKTSELESIKDPVTFTSFCHCVCWNLRMFHVGIGVRTGCDSQLQPLSYWAGGILTIGKIITTQLNKSGQVCSCVTIFRYLNSTF